MSGLFAQAGLGELLAVGASLSYSTSLIAIRQGVRSATPIAGVLILSATVSVLGLTIAAARGTLFESSLTPVLIFMLGGCLGQGVGQLTNAIGIEKMGVSRSVPIQSSTPIFSVTFAMIFLGERPGVGVAMGTVLIVAGVCLLSLGERRSGQSFKSFFQGGARLPAHIVALLCAAARAGERRVLLPENPHPGLRMRLHGGNHPARGNAPPPARRRQARSRQEGRLPFSRRGGHHDAGGHHVLDGDEHRARLDGTAAEQARAPVGGAVDISVFRRARAHHLAHRLRGGDGRGRRRADHRFQVKTPVRG